MNVHGPRANVRMGKPATKGFSLIELLIVVFIILIIVRDCHSWLVQIKDSRE